mgnify:FL=1|tara:strand:+ start:336 stop:860 length:525 start_codon:yes stop_codon:yes gene_type:complete
MGIFDIFKNKKNEKVAIDNVKKKLKDDENLVQAVRNYWSQIIAGDINLENGEKFKQETFYNKKHLKYDPDVIKGVLVSIAITSEDKNFKEICQTCYMYLAAFEKKEVKDKIETRVAQGLPLLEEIGKIKDNDEKFKKIQEYGKNLPQDKPGYSSEDLKNLQVHLAELFGRLVQI